MAERNRIEVNELRVGLVQQTDVVRNGDELVLLIDGQQYRFDAARATALAWAICSQVDAIRTEQIEVSAQRHSDGFDCREQLATDG